jgi:hypothetical protein
MPRLFVANFDFEHQLADPAAQTPARLIRLNAELATAWLAIADDDDVLWTPEPIHSDFFLAAAEAGLPRVTGTMQPARLPGLLECVPWGWTDRLRTLCQEREWTAEAPSAAAVAATNSREFSARLEHEWNIALPGAGPAASIDDVERRLDQLSGPNERPRWVIKAQFGMSGRERLLGSGPLTPPAEGWIRKRLTDDGLVFVEPWVERIFEVGLQFDVPRSGSPVLLGCVPLLSNASGQYRGSWFAPPAALATVHTIPSTAVEVCRSAARRVQDFGYFGPLGIDAMCYRTADGQTAWRPLQDINARWTMGRLSLGLRRLLDAEECGLWWHGSATERPGLRESIMVRQICNANGLTVSQIVATSPDQVAASPCGQASAAILFQPAKGI